MKRAEMLFGILISYLMLTIGMAIILGPWVLVGAGVAGLVSSTLINVKE